MKRRSAAFFTKIVTGTFSTIRFRRSRLRSRSRCADILSVTSSCVVTHPPSAIGLDTVWTVRPLAVFSIVLRILPSAIAA
jgi:hypothetical protein